jgi:L-rhamnose isomerase
MSRLQFLSDERNKAINALPPSHHDDAQDSFDSYLIGALSGMDTEEDWKSAVATACECVSLYHKPTAKSQELGASS